MQGSRPIKKIVIVGGGTAGWMAGAALSRLLPPETVEITLIESEQIGTVGVGEATLPSLQEFNGILGISEPEFMAATSATIKYGIEFAGWTRDGDSYFHPFGTHGMAMGGFPFHQFWRRAYGQGKAARIEQYCLTAQAAMYCKAAAPSRDPNSPLSMLSHAYQFDASKYAAFLRARAESQGLTRIEGKVVSVNLNDESGFIESVDLANGASVEGDLFIDCSGFRALLLGQALGVGYEDWSSWLPVNSAVTAQTEKIGHAPPYTRCTAKSAGWQWRIPLQHRTGNGYVYCDKYIDQAAATDEFEAGLDAPMITDLKHLRFTTGRRKNLWEKNCIGLGLSSGFLEPLESTSIYLIQTGIKVLVSLFPDADCPRVEQDEYNAIMHKEFGQIRDFLLLHYVANNREGHPFWDDLRALELPDTLAQKIALFKERGRFFRYDGDLFTETSWVAVFLGQGISPAGHNPLIEAMPDAQLADTLARLERGIASAVKAMPTHEDFIARSGGAFRANTAQ